MKARGHGLGKPGQRGVGLHHRQAGEKLRLFSWRADPLSEATGA